MHTGRAHKGEDIPGTGIHRRRGTKKSANSSMCDAHQGAGHISGKAHCWAAAAAAVAVPALVEPVAVATSAITVL
jgi:hypothetical protein